ncbi:hypothetical protein SK128_026322 [Halocaridina rubra]|uniref:Uncharacterized protein n=1 Tax=Halocaridina rubra TaxID=373956 RepID=A0AAN8XE54_HALRR
MARDTTSKTEENLKSFLLFCYLYLLPLYFEKVTSLGHEIRALLCIALDNKTKIPVENYKSRNLLQTVSVQDETHIQASNGESEEENNEKENTEKKRTNGTANSEQSAFRKEIPKGRKEANFEEVIPSRTNITEDLMGNDTKISSNGQRGSEYHVDVPDKTVQRNYTLQSTTVHSTNPLYSHHDIIIRQQQRKENEVTSIHSTLTMSPIQGSENRNENSLNRPLLDMTNVQQEIQNRSAPSQQLRKSGDAESLNFIHEIKSSQIFGNSSSVYIKNGKPFSHVGDEGLDDSIHKAIINVVKTIRNKNIYIVLQSQYDTDSYIVRDLWNGGLPVHIFESELWWEEISQLTYFHYTQHILLGPLEWIVSTMQKNTQWIWIPTKPSQPKSPTRNPLPISAYFSKCVKEISQQLQEGIRGVLLVTDELVYQKRNDSLEKNTSKKR